MNNKQSSCCKLQSTFFPLTLEKPLLHPCRDAKGSRQGTRISMGESHGLVEKLKLIHGLLPLSPVPPLLRLRCLSQVHVVRPADAAASLISPVRNSISRDGSCCEHRGWGWVLLVARAWRWMSKEWRLCWYPLGHVVPPHFHHTWLRQLRDIALVAFFDQRGRIRATFLCARLLHEPILPRLRHHPPLQPAPPRGVLVQALTFWHSDAWITTLAWWERVSKCSIKWVTFKYIIYTFWARE